VPGDAFAQVKCDCFAAVLNRPSAEIADQLDVLVVLYEAVEYLVVDRARRRVIGYDRVQPRASPMELTKVFGFLSTSWTQAEV
jgi:hypothetical protein